MAEIKVPQKNNPSSFNAGASLKNNRVPSADQKNKKMSSTGSEPSKGEDLKKKVKSGVKNAKREIKKEAIAVGVQALSEGAIDHNITKKALDTKLGNKLVDSLQTPVEKLQTKKDNYKEKKEKIRQKRANRGQDPDHPFLWYEALPIEAKFGIWFIVGMIAMIFLFIIIFSSVFENNSLLKAQSFAYISGQNAGNKLQNILSSDTSLSEKFINIFDSFIVRDFDNIGNIFTGGSKCSGDDCGSRAEVMYFQKISDISYRYKMLYDIELDWPLIIASNLSQSSDKEQTFKDNLNDYDDISNLDEVMNLDWEYDYEKIDGYTYLDADDSRFDLQLLAKNMVTKTTIQSCVLDDDILETTTLTDVMDSELTEDSEFYLECIQGEYVVESTYELDFDKYDEFLTEYVEKKYFVDGSGFMNNETGNSGGSSAIISGASSIANAFVMQARNQLTNNDNSIYWKYMGYSSRVPWCAAFVAWVTNNTSYEGQALYPNIIKTKTASAAGYMRYFIDSGDGNINFRYNNNCNKYSDKGSYTPKPGDLIFFDWQQSWNGNLSGIQIGNGVIDHVGIVEKVQGGQVYTIEGNSSDDVRSRQYSLSSCKVVGYGSWY